jgi:hypothetical protein
MATALSGYVSADHAHAHPPVGPMGNPAPRGHGT